MIEFKKVRWKNFLSTGNIFSEIPLDIEGCSLIIGENGSGKSTVVDAISFGLFGKPHRAMNKPQLINSITQKNMVVEIEFSLYDKNYKIIRGMKPNIFEIYVNDKLINQSSDSRDYQSFLEQEILKTNSRTFSQIVLLGANTFVPFAQLPLAQRRSFVEEILNLQIFSKMNVLLKERKNNFYENYQKIKNEKIITQQKIEFIQQQIKKFSHNENVLKQEKEKKIKEIKNKIEVLKKEKNELKERLNNYEVSSLNVLQEKKNKTKNGHDKCSFRITLIEKENTFFRENDVCPTCFQKIDNDYKNVIMSKNEKKKEEYEKLLFDFKNKILKLDEELEQEKKKEKEKKEIENELTKKDIELSFLEKNLESLLNEKEVYEVISIKENYSAIVSELDKIEKEITKIKEEERIYEISEILLKDDGIKASIIKQYLPKINNTINKYLEELEMFINYQIDEEFNENILSRHRDNFSYFSFSEGEKQKIDLAFLFSWRDLAKSINSLNCNILFLDEVLGGPLDYQSIENLQKILYQKSKNNNIFLVTHRSEFTEKSLFKNIFKVTKTKNFSTIERSR